MILRVRRGVRGGLLVLVSLSEGRERCSSGVTWFAVLENACLLCPILVTMGPGHKNGVVWWVCQADRGRRVQVE